MDGICGLIRRDKMFSKACFLRAYYDKLTGNGLIWYAFTNELYRIPTFAEDYQSFIDLSKRNADIIGWIDFENGEYHQDFLQSNAFRVNPETLELEFSYPDPNATEPQEPVYQKPLTEQIEELRQENITTLLALTEVYEMIIGGGGA
jgi:hypothetical protein